MTILASTSVSAGALRSLTEPICREGASTTDPTATRKLKISLRASAPGSLQTITQSNPPTETTDLSIYRVTTEQLEEYRRYAFQYREDNKIEPGKHVRLWKGETTLPHTITSLGDGSTIVHTKRKKIYRMGLVGIGVYKKVYEALRYYPDGVVVRVADVTIFRDLDKFQTEFEALKQLNTAGCIHVPEEGIFLGSYDSFRRGGSGYIKKGRRLCIIMPLYIPIDQNQITTRSSEMRLSLISGTVKGVCELHSQTPPMIHRDIKIENFLFKKLTKHNLSHLRVLICDLGCATREPAPNELVGKRTTIERLQQALKGNRGHWPPEILNAVISTPPIYVLQNRSCDIWAIGILFYSVFFAEDLLDFPQFVCDAAFNNIKILPEHVTNFFINMRKYYIKDPIHSKVIDLMQDCMKYNPIERITAPELLKKLNALYFEIASRPASGEDP